MYLLCNNTISYYANEYIFKVLLRNQLFIITQTSIEWLYSTILLILHTPLRFPRLLNEHYISWVFPIFSKRFKITKRHQYKFGFEAFVFKWIPKILKIRVLMRIINLNFHVSCSYFDNGLTKKIFGFLEFSWG